jgi:hypothetical protein
MMKPSGSSLECYLYIELNPSEWGDRYAAESLQALSQVQLNLVRQLSFKGPIYGMLYLGDVVKSAAPYARDAFVKDLLRSDKP